MTDRYEQIFKQLYERRLIQHQAPDNSYDRVRLIQKKMSQNMGRKVSRTTFSFEVGDCAPFLEEPTADPPKIIKRQTFEGFKIRKDRRLSLPTHRESFQQFATENNSNQKPPSISQYLKKNSSLTQRSKPHNLYPTSLYHSKKFQIIRKNIPATAEPSSRIQLSKRATTPSKNVLIGGCNLEKQAQTYRKQFKKLQEEVQKYNIEMKNKQQLTAPRQVQSRIRMSRSQRQNNANFRNEGWIKNHGKQIIRKLQVSKGREKDEVPDLLPWTVLVPEYQYY